MEKKAAQKCSRMLRKAPASRAAPGGLKQPPREREKEREGQRGREGWRWVRLGSSHALHGPDWQPEKALLQNPRAPSRSPSGISLLLCALQVIAEKFVSAVQTHKHSPCCLLESCSFSLKSRDFPSPSPPLHKGCLLRSAPAPLLVFRNVFPLKEQI